jgi:hypothetical protein
MNDAIWLGAHKVLPVNGEVRMLDCDSSIMRVYENGVPREEISRNNGLIVIADGVLQQISRAGNVTLVATMPEPITATRLTTNNSRNDSFF